MDDAILEIKDLKVRFKDKYAIKGISLYAMRHERIGIVGESGSGKSLTALSSMALVKEARGEILFEGKDMLSLKEKELSRIRGKDIALIFQDPSTSINPVKKISRIMRESIRMPGSASGEDVMERIRQALSETALDESILDKRIDELSGGMKQRLSIALAILNAPKLIIADEITTALDVSLERDILDLIKRIGCTLIIISHDLSVISYTAERIYVMYKGKIVEHGRKDEILSDPLHPYTKTLLNPTLPLAPFNLESNTYFWKTGTHYVLGGSYGHA